MRPVNNPDYRSPKGIGYFLNILSRLDEWIVHENRRGMDIPRFTKNQVRRIALFLERNYLFNFDMLRTDGGRARREREIRKARRAQERAAAKKALEHGASNRPPMRERWGTDVPQMALANRQAPFEASTGPAPVQGRPRPCWDDQVREFKRIVKEEKQDLPASVIDQMLD